MPFNYWVAKQVLLFVGKQNFLRFLPHIKRANFRTLYLVIPVECAGLALITPPESAKANSQESNQLLFYHATESMREQHAFVLPC